MIDSEINVLLRRYKEVFTLGLGTMKHFEAKLQVRSESTPVFHRPHLVPFAVKDAIEIELQHLEKASIIEKVMRSEWAAPVVVVPKGDGKIRLCGDNKVTVNKSLEIDQHPLPRPDELFATLTGGVKFSKINFTQAYQQMIIDKDSRTYRIAGMLGGGKVW